MFQTCLYTPGYLLILFKVPLCLQEALKQLNMTAISLEVLSNGSQIPLLTPSQTPLLLCNSHLRRS